MVFDFASNYCTKVVLYKISYYIAFTSFIPLLTLLVLIRILFLKWNCLIYRTFTTFLGMIIMEDPTLKDEVVVFFYGQAL
jgi:hypothetical protein